MLSLLTEKIEAEIFGNKRRKQQMAVNEYLGEYNGSLRKTLILFKAKYNLLFNDHLNSYFVHIQCSPLIWCRRHSWWETMRDKDRRTKERGKNKNNRFPRRLSIVSSTLEERAQCSQLNNILQLLSVLKDLSRKMLSSLNWSVKEKTENKLLQSIWSQILFSKLRKYK